MLTLFSIVGEQIVSGIFCREGCARKEVDFYREASLRLCIDEGVLGSDIKSGMYVVQRIAYYVLGIDGISSIYSNCEAQAHKISAPERRVHTAIDR